MSRIGRAPVPIPKGVEGQVEGTHVAVQGPKGKRERTFHPDMHVALQDGKLVVTRATDQRQHRALHGLTRALLANMVRGVTDGDRGELEIQGGGYRAAQHGSNPTLSV